MVRLLAHRVLLAGVGAFCCAAVAVAGPGDSGTPDANAIQQNGVGGASAPRGPVVPPNAAAPIVNNRPLPVNPARPQGRNPIIPNGGPFHFNEGEGPMTAPGAPVPPSTTPVPLPSPAGLVVTGLLAGAAIRRRRAL